MGRDVLPLFTCLVDRIESPDGGYYLATCAAFPGLNGTGRNSEQARESLAAMVLNFYGAAREQGLMLEP